MLPAWTRAPHVPGLGAAALRSGGVGATFWAYEWLGSAWVLGGGAIGVADPRRVPSGGCMGGCDPRPDDSLTTWIEPLAFFTICMDP